MASSRNILAELHILYSTLSVSSKRRFALLVIWLVFGSIAEVFAIGSIFPFLAVITDSSSFFKSYPWIEVLLPVSKDNESQIILIFTSLFIAIITVANIFRVSVMYASIYTGFKLGGEVGKSIFSAMLHFSYEKHRLLSTSVAVVNATSKSSIIIYNVITPCINVIAVSVLVILATVGIIITAPLEVIFPISIMCGLYLIANILTKNILAKCSSTINYNTTKLVKETHDAFGSIKEIILYSLHAKYEERYGKTDMTLRIAQGRAAFMAAVPKYFLEALAVIGLAIFAYKSKNENMELFAVIGLIAFAIQRLLPQLQQAYSSCSSIMGAKEVLLEINDILKSKKNGILDNSNTCFFKEKITLENVSYRSLDSSNLVLENISCEFRLGTMTAIIGNSGSGKSTLLDIICGLRAPTFGDLLIDGNRLEEKLLGSWQSKISYVSQDPFIFEGSIARNIASAFENDPIDFDRMVMASKEAQIYEWIMSLPNGFDTLLVERGLNISGGQKQRICIAKALYRKSLVLCLDESSSGLDESTEIALYETIKKLKSTMAVIIATHRIATLKYFDSVYKISDGKVIQYDHRVKKN